jgi:hypothetical protein
MSLIWKLEIDGVKLFTKLSKDEIGCNICDPNNRIKLHDGSITKATKHVKEHSKYQKQLDNLKKLEQRKAETQQSSLTSFLINGISLDDRKIIEFIGAPISRS